MFNELKHVRTVNSDSECLRSASTPRDKAIKKPHLWKGGQTVWVILWNGAGKGVTYGIWPPRLEGLFFEEDRHIEVLCGQEGPLTMHYAIKMAQVFETEQEALDALVKKIQGEKNEIKT